MNTDKDNKNLDELITGAISRETPEFDFSKWKQNHKKEIDIFESQVRPNSATFETNIRLVTLWQKFGSLAAAFLIISSLIACFVLYREVTDLRNDLFERDVAAAPINDSVTINFYLKEHQDFIAQQASLNSAASQSIQINQDDIMYYEFLDDQSGFLNPGIILRGPSSQQEIGSSESSSPAISNGHTQTLSEARETANFNLLILPRFHPGYQLDQIRRISGRDAMHLLYTNSINSVSLFEQPLDGQRGLSHQDFREYAVYNNQEEGRGTILAWRDDVLSYVLIGNIEISQLMDMAQSISAIK